MSGTGNVARVVQKRFLSLLKALSGLEIRSGPEGYTVDQAALLETPPRLLVRMILIILSLMFLGSVLAFPYCSPVTNVEEVALFYTSAGNMLRFGFVNSMFLPDYSTSSSVLDHPYVYSHMPPGPDILIAVLLQLSSGSHRLVRLLFWALFLLGMICYFRFARLILDQFKVTGAGYAILLISPYSILHTFDDPVYAMFPLLAFLPLLTLQAYYRTTRWRYLAITLGVGLLSAVYLDYLTLLVVASCWGLLHFTQLVPLKRRHLLAFAGVILAGVALHLLQNFLYMGAELFFRELRMTIANRMTGFPSQEEMKAFYQANSLVHHGAAKLNIMGFLFHLWAGVSIPGFGYLLGAVLIGSAAVVARNMRRTDDAQALVILRNPELLEFTRILKRFMALWLWVAGTILLPMFMFPAFTQEYGIDGTGLHWYFLAIGTTATVLYGLKALYGRFLQLRMAPGRPGPDWSDEISRYLGRASVLLIVFALFIASIASAILFQATEFKAAVKAYRDTKHSRLEEIRRQYGGVLFMTNINPVTVGFFAAEAGYGVCELSALPQAGDIDASQCRVSYMRRHDHHATARPRYFFFFRDIFPGFLRCLPPSYVPLTDEGGDKCFETMQHRLADRFHLVADTGLYQVYDLTRKAERP